MLSSSACRLSFFMRAACWKSLFPNFKKKSYWTRVAALAQWMHINFGMLLSEKLILSTSRTFEKSNGHHRFKKNPVDKQTDISILFIRQICNLPMKVPCTPLVCSGKSSFVDK
jgi:hypothetical protein